MMGTRIHNAELIYPELSYSIIGAAMDVHNGLGPGWDEWDYHRSMIEVLQGRGHRVLSHDRKELVHGGKVVDSFELDLLVDDLVILELKHIKSNFHPKHYMQIINYLKRWEKMLGILINYGLEKLRYQRVPFTPVQGGIRSTGNWAEHQSHKSTVVASAVDAIMRKHGLGYGVDVFKKLLWAELEQNKVKTLRPNLTPQFGSSSFGERTVDAMIIESNLMVSVSSSSADTSAADLGYLKTYMKQAGVLYGILVNIGSSEVQLRGVL